MRYYTKPGDIYEVRFEDGKKRYLQYVAKDRTDLNSDVLRIFKSLYPVSETPSLESIVSDEVDFYTHSSAKLGLQLGCWKKIGNSQETGTLKIRFKQCIDLDSDKNDVFTSDNWVIWTINEDRVFIGKLPQDYYHFDKGGVKSPATVADSMHQCVSQKSFPGSRADGFAPHTVQVVSHG